MHCPKASRKGIALNTEEERRKGKESLAEPSIGEERRGEEATRRAPLRNGTAARDMA